MSKHQLMADFYDSETVRFMCSTGEFVRAGNPTPIASLILQVPLDVGEPWTEDDNLLHFIRETCAAEFKLRYDTDFFSADYQEGETADEALLRLFKAEQEASGASNLEVALVMIYG